MKSIMARSARPAAARRTRQRGADAVRNGRRNRTTIDRHHQLCAPIHSQTRVLSVQHRARLRPPYGRATSHGRRTVRPATEPHRVRNMRACPKSEPRVVADSSRSPLAHDWRWSRLRLVPHPEPQDGSGHACHLAWDPASGLDRCGEPSAISSPVIKGVSPACNFVMLSTTRPTRAGPPSPHCLSSSLLRQHHVSACLSTASDGPHAMRSWVEPVSCVHQFWP